MTYEEAANAIKTWFGPMKKLHEGDDFANEFIDAADFMTSSVVREAVEKQIPQKPKRSGKYGVCPSCSRLIERYEQKHGNIEIPHCKWCGKKLDWSDSDDK